MRKDKKTKIDMKSETYKDCPKRFQKRGMNIMKEFFKAIGRGIVKGAIYIYCKIVYRLKIVGKENIPKEGPVIICGNHRSYLDPPLIESTARRYARFLAKEELTKNKFLAFLGFIFDAILVKRDSKEVTSIKESLKTLKEGKCLALFPEGTRNKSGSEDMQSQDHK